jgi:protein-S-isoprenylcysteine O-methyltransferase Ste14
VKKRIRTQVALVFSAIAAIVLFAFVFPHWKNEEMDELLDVLGIIIFLSGFLFRISARGYKEEESANGHRLVTGGPYQLMRNPMYYGTFLIGIGFIAVLLEWWALPVFLSAFFFIYIPQVDKEEALLMNRFGQEYVNYCAQTPKYFPRSGHLLRLKRYLPLKLSWLKRELPSTLSLTAILICVEIWEDSGLFGPDELAKEAREIVFTIVLFVSVILILFREKRKP